MSTRAQMERILGKPLSHIGYVVEDLATAVDRWAAFGIGPFFHIEDPVPQTVESRGAPAVFRHSGAFSWWGDLGLELHQIAEIQPPDAAQMMGVGKGHAVNHVAFETATPEEDSARLEELGMPLFLFADFGPVQDRIHYAPFLGHAVEVHRESAFLTDFWNMIEGASKDWDGSDPLRRLEI